jgi:hypothetical protein
VLAEHRIDDANECLVAVEEAVPSGEQVPFQPPLALMLAEHRVQDASGGCEELVVLRIAGIPLTIGDLEHRAEQIRERLVRPEDAKVALFLIEPRDVAQESAQDERVLTDDSPRRRYVERVDVKVRHA